MRIESGRIAGSVNQADWNLLNGNGPRVYKKHVNFSRLFNATPTVVVSIVHLDINSNTNTRIEVTAEGVDRDGFEVAIGTWANTSIYGASVSWIAYGD